MKDKVRIKDQVCFLLNGKPIVPKEEKKVEEEKKAALLTKPKTGK